MWTNSPVLHEGGVPPCSSRVQLSEFNIFITEARNYAKTTKTQAQVIKQQ